MIISTLIRATVQDLRTRPVPLKDLIPLMQQAADALDTMEAERARLIEHVRVARELLHYLRQGRMSYSEAQFIQATAQYESTTPVSLRAGLVKAIEEHNE